jgi:uncharacterized protein YjbI with pentapeptide repeats
MANQEQLSILKQGVEAWNKWRERNLDTEIDLREANLAKTNLSGVNFTFTSHLDGDDVAADLRRAKLIEANLSGADFTGANLAGADLRDASLVGADLHEANLGGADLTGTNLFGADLNRSNLKESVLRVRGGHTNFGDVDVSETIGLEDIVHVGPSTIGISAFAKSKGKIPEVFLRGCGLSDADIEYSKLSNPGLSNEEINRILYKLYDLRATQALQISPLFISYSHADSKFVDMIGSRLAEKGVRYWRDIKDLKAGRVEKQLDRAIRQNPTVLLVLSKDSLSSDWVEHEVRTARGLEKEMGRDALCPVALDDSWKSSPWPKRIMEQIMEYNILDFSDWKDDSKFDGMFRKLIDGLELFYRG